MSKVFGIGEIMSKIIRLPNMQERYNRVERTKRENFRRRGETEEQLVRKRASALIGRLWLYKKGDK